MLTIRFEKLDICVKKLIVPPKNIPCFDVHKEWPKAIACGASKHEMFSYILCETSSIDGISIAVS